MENDKKRNSGLVALVIFCMILVIGGIIKFVMTDKKNNNAEGELKISSSSGVDEAVSAGGMTEYETEGNQEKAIEYETSEPGEETDETKDGVTEELQIHQYEVFIEDCTWEDAFMKAKHSGGYLLRINTEEEYNVIARMINDPRFSKIHYYLGGRRASDGHDYYWVDDDNQFFGDSLNQGGIWYETYWYPDEPSYADTGEGADIPVAEDCMNLFHVGDNWYFNDSSGDLAGNYPDFLGGKIGYIVEYP